MTCHKSYKSQSGLAFHNKPIIKILNIVAICAANPFQDHLMFKDTLKPFIPRPKLFLANGVAKILDPQVDEICIFMQSTMGYDLVVTFVLKSSSVKAVWIGT